VTDLGPLEDCPLEKLICTVTKVRDLAPLRGLPLKELFFGASHVSDLSPLQGMQLAHLGFHACKGIDDLTPLKGMPLTWLLFSETRVADLSPLTGMAITSLHLEGSKVSDLRPLAGMPLEKLSLTPGNIQKGWEVIRSMPGLKEIGVGSGSLLPAKEFWELYGPREETGEEDDADVMVAAEGAGSRAIGPAQGTVPKPKVGVGPADDSESAADGTRGIGESPDVDTQRSSHELDPDDPVLARRSSPSAARRKISLTELQVLADAARSSNDWLAQLKYGEAALQHSQFGQAESAYRGAMAIIEKENLSEQWLERCEKALERCSIEKERAEVKTLCEKWYPERDRLSGTEQAREILQKLRECNGKIGNWHYELENDRLVSLSTENGLDTLYLEPLTGLHLRSLALKHCRRLRDLSPLRGMPLQSLTLGRCGGISDLSPLKNMPLKSLALAVPDGADLSVLRGLPLASLDLTCSLPVTTVLGELTGLKSLGLHAYAMKWIRDIRDLKLERLDLSGCVFLHSIHPLAGMPLKSLDLSGCWSVSDLSPLKNTPLEGFRLKYCWEQIRDPSGVEHVPIERVQERVASVYLKYGKFGDAERVYRSMAKKWPGSEAAFLGLRTLAQINLQQATPKGRATRYIAAAPHSDQFGQLRIVRTKQRPLEGMSLERALDIGKYMVDNWPSPARRATSHTLQARAFIEQMRLNEARKSLAAVLKQCSRFEAGGTPYPGAVAAACLLGETLTVGGEPVSPGEADLGLPPDATTMATLGEDGAIREPLKMGPTEVAWTIRTTRWFLYYHTSGSWSTYATELRLEDTPSAPLFFVAARHLLRGEKREAIRRLKECVEADPESSYAKQAGRMLTKIAK